MGKEQIVKQIAEYKVRASREKCYNTGRTYKDGTITRGIAFYYPAISGKKERKVFTGRSDEELYDKAAEFLEQLCMEKLILLEKKELAILNAATQPTMVSPVPAVAGTCDKTVAMVVDSYLESYLPTVGYSHGNTQTYYEGIVKKRIGHLKLAAFGFSEYQTFMNGLLYMDDGTTLRAEKTLKEMRKFMNNVMKHAWKQGYISREDMERAIDGIKIPSGAKEYDKDQKCFSYSEIGRILYCIRDHRKYRLLTQIALLTGMRGQEIFALEKQDLVRSEHYISVRQALKETKKNCAEARSFDVGATKTQSSRRKVPASDKVFRLFDELEKEMVQSGNREKSIAQGNGSYILVDSNGNLVDKRALLRNWKHYLKSRAGKYFNGISDDEKEASMHCFRHCYTTYLSEMGATEEKIDKCVGHSRNSTTNRYYNSDNTSHIEYMLPLIERMDTKIQEAYRAACSEVLENSMHLM